jgi:hypothetical protein
MGTKKIIYVTTIVYDISDFKKNNPNLLIINKRYNIADLFDCHKKIKKYMFFLFLLKKIRRYKKIVIPLYRD